MQTNRISSPWTRAAGAALLACCSWVMAAPGGETPPPNPYPVERSWPEYFLEHQKLFTEQAGTYRAGDYILKNRERIINNAHEAYANYYNAQAMFQLGGRWWEDYAEWMYSHYIPLQSADGSWSEGRNGGTYGTTMMVLSFTVPYRQLPIYQRDETVDEDS